MTTSHSLAPPRSTWTRTLQNSIYTRTSRNLWAAKFRNQSDLACWNRHQFLTRWSPSRLTWVLRRTSILLDCLLLGRLASNPKCSRAQTTCSRSNFSLILLNKKYKMVFSELMKCRGRACSSLPPRSSTRTTALWSYWEQNRSPRRTRPNHSLNKLRSWGPTSRQLLLKQSIT